MKKIIERIVLFSIPGIFYSILAVLLMPSLLSIQNGPSTKQQIDFSFKRALNTDYSVLILGNSRTYRGLNPDMFSLKTFNFSHDNDSYNQLFYKLKFLIDRRKKIDILILGVDYFQLSFLSNTRNYVYADYLGKDYCKDFDDNILINKLEYHLGNANPKKVSSLLLNLLLRTHKNKPTLKENGQYIRDGAAWEGDKIQRDITRLKIQVDYFNKIVELCKSKRIKTFLLMLPTRQNELNSYSKEEILQFNSFINNTIYDTNVVWLNFSKNKDFNIKDYTDITHFTEDAANKFSKMLNDKIMRIIKQD